MSTIADGFSAGRVLTQASSIYSRNCLSFFAISLIVTAPPYLLFWMLVPIQETRGPYFSSPQLLIDVADALLQYIVTGILVYDIVQALKGRQTSIGKSIYRGFSAIWRVIGVAVAAYVIIGLGSLLIVPGFIFFVMYWVAVPATVMESCGVGASLNRSQELTRGHRWKVFAVAVVPICMLGVLVAVLELVLPTLLLAVEPRWVSINILAGSVANFVAGVLITPLIAAAAAISYSDLRAIKEGIDIDEIAAVFD